MNCSSTQLRSFASRAPRLGVNLCWRERAPCGRRLPRAERRFKEAYHLSRPATRGTPGPSDEEEKEKEETLAEKLSKPVAALVVCALLSGAVLPEEALAARSGGRIGGSSFRSRAAPSMPRGGGGGSSFRQYNYYSPGVAPPLVGGYGYGLGGYSLMPSFFFPIGFGGFFNIFITLFILSAVVNTIRNFQRKDDDRDDFDDM